MSAVFLLFIPSPSFWRPEELAVLFVLIFKRTNCEGTDKGESFVLDTALALIEGHPELPHPSQNRA